MLHELMRCPFCGGQAAFVPEEINGERTLWIACGGCGIRVGKAPIIQHNQGQAEERLTERWNQRVKHVLTEVIKANDPLHQEQLDTLLEALFEEEITTEASTFSQEREDTFFALRVYDLLSHMFRAGFYLGVEVGIDAAKRSDADQDGGLN